ncbi:host cell division inhibitory peptide Kil [Salmonella enterica]|uniref:Host cell division inhibitory peptide Kil n=1 Tax=Salmonella enterica subsp. enterica serovar Saintpaul TaxID=90105 RepID=A0A5U9IBJ9_SALET|nr:host cell division inhibitory peptide Kil [Salmonella enterica]EBS2302372.1 host cell division inhibitory peptide Kil [Salmonella enterica subsp. enterica serovar Saintpaul]EDW0015909.1 host cell division inhibitory peptide Kil [Salmonella enterica subsp. enterica serovar Aba]EED7477773.1 host cell division inhibitory peptide Kil [Salmonella enterica subsp. enterica]HCZ4729940.1 host cell division inhibitory peptide Kil [Salmonella enterica subsp. enterica serovar Saintpaul str. CFSAN004137]
MDKTLMDIQSKFAIAVCLGDKIMYREAVEAYREWRLK